VARGRITLAPVAQQISAARFERDGRGCKSCREHHFSSPRSPTKRHSAQNGASAGANPAVGTTLSAPVAQSEEAADLRSAQCRCKSGREQFSDWSMNRTSGPGLRAKEIAPRGVGRKSSVLRFLARSLKQNLRPIPGKHLISARCRCKSCRADFLLAANAKQLEQPVFQAGPNGCESRRGYQFFARVAQQAEALGREPRGWECESPREHQFPGPEY
jgi:hypothetical protein